MHAASGLFSWTMELLACASRQFAPKTMNLAVHFIQSHFIQFFLVSERSGQRNLPAEQRKQRNPGSVPNKWYYRRQLQAEKAWEVGENTDDVFRSMRDPSTIMHYLVLKYVTQYPVVKILDQITSLGIDRKFPIFTYYMSNNNSLLLYIWTHCWKT